MVKTFLAIFFFGLGSSIFIGALIYTSETHKKQNYAKNTYIGGQGFLEQIIAYFMGKIFDLIPWWIMKIIYLFLGIVFIAFGIFILLLGFA